MYSSFCRSIIVQYAGLSVCLSVLFLAGLRELGQTRLSARPYICLSVCLCLPACLTVSCLNVRLFVFTSVLGNRPDLEDQSSKANGDLGSLGWHSQWTPTGEAQEKWAKANTKRNRETEEIQKKVWHHSERVGSLKKDESCIVSITIIN